jgi:hypothetical protein
MLKIMGIALVSGLILGCSGNSSSTRTVDEEVVTALSGQVGNATWGARITATSINSEGSPIRIVNDDGDVVLGGPSDLSAEDGLYEIIADGDLLGTTSVFIANDDNGAVGYRCEIVTGCGSAAYKAYYTLGDDVDIRAGVGEVADGMIVNINWLTDVASSLAKTVYIDALQNVQGLEDRADISAAVDTAKTGIYNEYTIELANLHVSKLFSISDIISVVPVGPSQITAENNLTSTQYEEGVYLGAILAALTAISVEQSESYMQTLEKVTETIILRNGQLLQKDTSGNEISLAQILNSAAVVLESNINAYENSGARVSNESKAALSKLKTRALQLIDGEETAVIIDVPAELASWKTNIGKAKEFIADLTEALKNFWGEDASKASFIDPSHARRLDTYYIAHEELYSQVSPSLIGPDGILQDILDAADYLMKCKISSSNCSVLDSRFVLSEEDSTVIIDETLKITMAPFASLGSDTNKYNQFDFVIDNDLNTLEKGGVKYEWKFDSISDGSYATLAFVRLFYQEDYLTPPSLEDVEPSQITVVWPSVSFESEIQGAGSDSGLHTFVILFEVNLVAVEDPLVGGNPEVRYNPFTVEFWVRSVNSNKSYFDIDEDSRAVVNNSAFISQLRTTYAFSFYPETKWPEKNQFFNSRDDSPDTIDDMVSILKSTETLSDGRVIDVFDRKLISDDTIARIRLYPYDASTDSTQSQSCSVTGTMPDNLVVGSCSQLLSLAGNITLDSLIQGNFESGALFTYAVKAHASYVIDLNDSEFGYNLVSESGEFNGLVDGVVYGPFTGTYSEPIELGIDQFSATFSSRMKDGDSEIPVVAQFTLQRQTEDFIAASLSYAFAEDDQLSEISDAVGVALGAEAQGLVFEYLVSEEEFINNDGELEIIEIEQGSWSVYRSGVSLGGENQSVLASAVSRVEYPQGDQELACGANDSDKLSSAGDCEAVAYLTFRGALLATIREERDGVFVARFVDGSWMVLGE